MEPMNDQLARYVVSYSMAPLPEVKEEDFEKQILEDVLPHFELTWRPIGIFRLEHHLLKRKSDDVANRYVWQIRLLSFDMVLHTTEEAVFAELDKRVRDRIGSLGHVGSHTILQEIGVVHTS